MAIYESEFQGATIDARLAAVATMQTAISNLETAVAAKYSKPANGIPETDLAANVQSALALARTAVQSLSDYYTKAQVDAITAAIAASVDSTSGVVVATLPSAGAGTLGKIYYVGPDGSGFYDRYVTSYDGSTYSWLALGNTEVDMTQYATKDEFNQLKEEIDGLPEVEIDSTDYSLVNGTIYNTEYRVAGAYGTNHRSRFVPIGDYKGRSLRVVAKSATLYVRICMVQTAPPLDANSNLSLATGWTGEVNIETQQTFVIPDNAEYAILYIEDIRYPATVRDPQSMTVLGASAAFVALNQGSENAGKYMAVGNDGKVVPVSSSPSPSPVSDKVVRRVETKAIPLGNDIASLDTLGAGWSGSVADGFTHSSGNTEPLTLNSTTEGTAYIITFIGTAANENAYTVRIGDTYDVDPYNGQLTQYAGIVSDGGKVIITPASSFAGTIQVKCQPVVAEGSAVETLQLSVLNVDADIMDSNVSGFWNVAIGPDETTMGESVNATRCVAVGMRALSHIVSGSRNVGVGTFALNGLKNGKGNIGIGADAYFLREEGDYNIAIGVAAIGGTGSAVNHNVAIGMSAGSMTSGDNNICIGKSAGYYATSDGIFIGELAGYNLTGVKNICIGRNAGYQAGSIAGNWNTLIGPSVQSTNGASKSTAIGFQAVIEKSSQVVLGSTDTQEVKLFGDIVNRGTDGVVRRIKFNNDNTVTWETVS